MAAPPNLPPIPADLLLSVTHPFSDSQYLPSVDTHDNDRNSMPPPPILPPIHTGSSNEGTGIIPPPPSVPMPMPDPHSSEPRPRSRSRSRSRTPSEHSASDPEESEDEESEQPCHHWRPVVEDRTAPCEDELSYIKSKEEHSAVNTRDHFEKETFFELEDEAFEIVDTGRIDWLVERFNGTKEEPNTDYIMRSQIVSIGGYDWRIKFFPRGHNTDFLSVYIENVTMQSAEFEEFAESNSLPFPLLNGHDYRDLNMKKRRVVAAQVSMVMYNPHEPRTYEFKTDAHQFSKRSADFGWRYFTHRDDVNLRRHGQREALLRRDQLAFSTYIRVVEDPTGCMWDHADDESFENIVLSTGLRPFSGQTPVLAAVLPLLHFEPVRQWLYSYKDATCMAYGLQEILWKMLTRTRSSHYGRRVTDVGQSDAITWLRKIYRTLRNESNDAATVSGLIGDFDAENGRAAMRSNRLKTKSCASIQQAVNQLPARLATPGMLTMELQRQEFDREKRKWNKLTNKVEVEDVVQVSGTRYHLHASITHCGDLQSNKHNVYVKAGGGIWYAYEDCKVTAMTRKQAVVAHEGSDRAKQDERRDSPFQGYHRSPDDEEDDEIIYAVMYVRDDNHCHDVPEVEAWELPDGIKEHKRWSDDMARRKVLAETGLCSSVSEGERTSLEHDISERDGREERDAVEGAATPDWPLTVRLPGGPSVPVMYADEVQDEEGDVVMSDAGDDEDGDVHADGASLHLDRVESGNDLAASTYLAKIPTMTSSTERRRVVFDCLGRDYYSGETLGDTYHGEGHLITMSGDEYTGSFLHGHKSGNGTIIYATTGNTYQGSWLENQHHGHGKLTEAATGNVFEGGWKDGKKHGSFVLKGSVTEEDRSCCTICYENEMTTAFYDCGHVVACKECAARIDSCPVCRRRVVGRLQIFGVKMTLE